MHVWTHLARSVDYPPTGSASFSGTWARTASFLLAHGVTFSEPTVGLRFGLGTPLGTARWTTFMSCLGCQSGYYVTLIKILKFLVRKSFVRQENFLRRLILCPIEAERAKNNLERAKEETCGIRRDIMGPTSRTGRSDLPYPSNLRSSLTAQNDFASQFAL